MKSSSTFFPPTSSLSCLSLFIPNSMYSSSIPLSQPSVASTAIASTAMGVELPIAI